jgi:IclR family KDG regulon transcriptional repressor
MKKPKSEYAIQTVTNALRLLEAFREEVDLGVTELSNRLGLHKNNVFRLLATLELAGYAQQCADSDRYELGPKTLELGQSFLRNREIGRRARRFLWKLAEETRETTHLAVMRGFAVVHLDGVQSSHLIRSSSRIGATLPVHCTALGKVLLGCSQDGLREQFDRTVVAEGGLAARTGATITDPHKFFEHIRTASVRGFALDLEECELGLRCAAAPVYDASGDVVAALSVSGPAQRMDEERLLQTLVPAVMDAADRLSRDLGYAA